ncbi:tRNA (cytidine(34)-2'-O)-methyltransferase [Devosia equisanguinis]|uniref:tRNA (cytidine(34)-2'-O)-methyltransferase n=1 Tax=Devosia equisanguinis TaxID=2490941 RepID=A0A447IDV4_9HYPH|nr:tRNA (cytidine(34)-2'-O)-methyltransferase [Devosia equisanguinis]VDS05612.1 tRNA (cytidine(34)-2'-O)-methyltransferase [Devosia equisanguinis]
MTLELALYQPDIAANTGTLLRLGACMGVPVHVIHPAGFAITQRNLARSGMDYLDRANLVEHDSFAAFQEWRRSAEKRLVLLTTKSSQSAFAVQYNENDILMLGRESAGVPDAVAEASDLRVRIPMQSGLRSLNVAIAGAMVLSEAMRQTGRFTSLAQGSNPQP